MKIISITLAGLLACSMLAFAAPDYKPPVGYVNDFAQIIPDDSENEMTQLLSSYEKETSVEIAVVTTTSLEGMEIEEWTIGLARAWGVGKKKKNNGLVIVVAPNERKYRIEIGYGLEGVVTDSIAGSLARNSLPKAFKAKRYTDGINSLLVSLMKTIGHESEAERASSLAARKLAQRAEERRQSELAVSLLHSFIILVLGIISALVLYFILRYLLRDVNERLRKRDQRTHIKKRLAEVTYSLTELSEKVSNMHPEDNLPKWIEPRLHELKSGAILSIKKACNAVKKTQQYKIDLEAANNCLNVSESNIKDIETNLQTFANISKEVTQFRKQTDHAVQSAVRQTEILVSSIHNMEKKGFVINPDYLSFDPKALKSATESLVEALSKRPYGVDDTSDRITMDANSLSEQVKKVSVSLTALEKAREYVNQTTSSLDEDITQAEKLLNDAKEVLKNAEPESAWINVKKGAEQATSLLTFIPAIKKEALKLVQDQSYVTAESELRKITASLIQVKQAANKVFTLQEEIERAKSKHQTLLSEAERKINKASQEVKNSDVGQDAKRLLNNAKAKFANASKVFNDKPVDWLLFVLLINEAIQLAVKATNVAKSDVSLASSTRSSGNSSIHNPSERSNSSSDNSFGGGSFGGGGASGGW